MAMKVGFVGLGIMGRPMALNLMQGGHTLAVYARRAESMAPLADAEATTCKSPAEVAATSDVTFVMVSDSPDVEAVVLGPGGCIEGARRSAYRLVAGPSSAPPIASRPRSCRLPPAGPFATNLSSVPLRSPTKTARISPLPPKTDG